MAASWTNMRPRHRLFMALWSLVIVIAAAVAFLTLVRSAAQHRADATERHVARISGVEHGKTPPERTPPAGHENDVPQRVSVGAYIDRIYELSIPDSAWKVDFYVWFNWEGGEKDFHPGETFKVVNGEVVSRGVMKKSETGSHHYEMYRASAQITKLFDVTNFPRDEHLLTLQIEDQALQSFELAYEVDKAPSAISSRVAVSGYKTASFQTNVVPHSYKSSMGDPSLPTTYNATYSQFILGIDLARANWGHFVKMFLASYIAVAVALAGIFLRSAAERLALSGSALFVVIMNDEVITPLIPASGSVTLADVINGICYVFVGISIAQGIIFHNIVDTPEAEDSPSPSSIQAFATVFDRVSLALLAGFFVLLNVAVLTSI